MTATLTLYGLSMCEFAAHELAYWLHHLDRECTG